MKASEYQTEAARTLIANDAVPAFPPRDVAVAWGLVEMAQWLGEDIDRVKKAVFHQHGYGEVERCNTIDRLVTLQQQADSTRNLLTGIDADRTRIMDAADLGAFDIRLLWNTLGVLGEGAEIARVILDALSENGYHQDALKKEIGDLCWYLAALCTLFDLDFGDVLAANIAKLKARYPAGWDAERSQQRDVAAEAAL